MKVSIITVCFNSEKTIEDTILSVINQDHDDIEYLIIDGASTDNTLQIIDLYRDNISSVISESDDGLYDAMNKGLELATGAVIGFINSDDIFDDNTCISEIVNIFELTNTDIVYGDILYVDRFDFSKVQRRWKSGKFQVDSYKKGWMPPHPATYIKRHVYEKFGRYNIEFKIAADYELMLRFIFRHEVTPVYLPKVISRMRTGGLSNRSIKNIINANLEVYKSCKLNELEVSVWIIFFKPLKKLKQYFHKTNDR